MKNTKMFFEDFEIGLVFKTGSKKITKEEIISFAKERIAGFKSPKSVDFISELPRNPSGKILKGNARKQFEIDRIKIDLKLTNLR